MSKSHYGAMDLHVARGGSGGGGGGNASTNVSNSNTSRKADDSGLSARNILIRRKLMERKRFDSADHAMRQQQHQEPPQQQQQPLPQQQQQQQQRQQKYSSLSAQQQPLSPAQMGASAFFNALGGGDENVDMDAAAAASSSSHVPVPAAKDASRYNGLSGPAGGAASARNILIQKKLREKRHFDSADYQLAHLKPHASPPPADALLDGGGDSGASPMEIDPTPATNPAVESINSPSAVSSRVDAQMSPSVRGGRYGGLSGASVLVTRKLSEKKRFDSADYQMQAGPAAAARAATAASQQGQSQRTGGGNPTSFFVPVAGPTSNLPAPPPGSGATGAIAAPVAAAPSSQSGSKYGKLSAVNVLIRKKLKERKRFDSADYAMEKQGQEEPSSGHQGGSAGALRGGHVVMEEPATHTTAATAMAATGDTAATPEENKSINHQVKHIKLSEGGGGWATRVPSATAPAASGAASAKLGAGGYGSLSQDSRLAARNLIIQRKLSERKRFDSADYYKEAAARGHGG